MISTFSASLTLHMIASYSKLTLIPWVTGALLNPWDLILVKRVLCHTVETKTFCVRFPRRWLWWLSSSGRWHRVTLIKIDVSEDRIASIFRVHECEQVTERSCKLLYRHRLRFQYGCPTTHCSLHTQNSVTPNSSLIPLTLDYYAWLSLLRVCAYTRAYNFAL
jgi:hypothetical protein